MTHDESEPQRRYDGPSLEEMGVRPEDCGIGHPHVDARALDMARLVVTKIEEDPMRFQIAYENLAREQQRSGTLTQARQEWLEILKRPWPNIRAILLDHSDEGQRLRSSHPFSGLITESERNHDPASASRGTTGLEAAAAAPTRRPRTATRRQASAAMTRDQPDAPPQD